MREIELKIGLDPVQERRLRASPVLRELGEGPARTETLESIYFDTPDHDLRRAGIALRLRRNGRRWVQTVKRAAGPMEQGLSTPEEDECAVAGHTLALSRIAGDDLREEVIGHARAGLAPVAKTRFRRTRRVLRLPSGGRVELCIDKGEIGAGDVTAPLLEAELELIEGTPADLYDLAGRLFREGPIRFAETTKSERAIRLAEPDKTGKRLRKARAVELARKMTAEAAAMAIMGEGLSHFLPNLALLLDSDDPGGAHQVRVSLRRLRSALTAFRPVLGRDTLAPWAEQARAIAAEAGRIRDLDVLIEGLVRPAARRAGDDPGFAALIDVLSARRERVRAEVRRCLGGAVVTGFGFGFAAFLAGRRWLDPADLDQTARLARPVGRFASKVIARRWRAVADYGEQIDALSIEERHEMRKELKKLRYMVDAFRSLYGEEDWRAFMAAVKPLQKAFGALNDHAMAEAMLTGPDAPLPDDPAAQRAIGRLLGQLDQAHERLWPAAVEGWRRLAQPPDPPKKQPSAPDGR